jgi:hypothetical protein
MRTIIFLALIGTIVFATAYAEEAAKSLYATKARTRLETLAKSQSNAQFLQSITNLPASIRKQLVQVADVGQPFSSGCVGSNPHRRFLAATRAGGTYHVAIEQGGFAYTWFIVQFAVDGAGEIVRETQIEPDGAANGSQPPRPETNRAPSAAGSAR